MASGHVLHRAKKEQGKGKTTNFAAPIFNSWSARDPSETTGAVVCVSRQNQDREKKLPCWWEGSGEKDPAVPGCTVLGFAPKVSQALV